MSPKTISTLLEIVKSQSTEEGFEWFERTLDQMSGPQVENMLLTAYTSSVRHLGRAAADTARVALLLRVSETSSKAFPSLALACYENGDSSEQQSWLRGLSLLPGCERFLATAIDSCRTNILPLFESIACENPYPARHFPELNFNQMILKSLFNGIALSRVVGLETRFNSELSRMANDYASEREAAGREVPVDIWLVVAPRTDAAGLERVQRYLSHRKPQHRHWAELGLSYRKD